MILSSVRMTSLHSSKCKIIKITSSKHHSVILFEPINHLILPIFFFVLLRNCLQLEISLEDQNAPRRSYK